MRVDVLNTLPAVAVDAAAVAEVIYMLLDNASKYAPENTEIRVGRPRGSMPGTSPLSCRRRARRATGAA